MPRKSVSGGLAVEFFRPRGIEAGKGAAAFVIERQLLAGDIPRLHAVDRSRATQGSGPKSLAELGLRRRDLAALAGYRCVPDAGDAAGSKVGCIGCGRGRQRCNLLAGAGCGWELRGGGAWCGRWRQCSAGDCARRCRFQRSRLLRVERGHARTLAPACRESHQRYGHKDGSRKCHSNLRRTLCVRCPIISCPTTKMEMVAKFQPHMVKIRFAVKSVA